MIASWCQEGSGGSGGIELMFLEYRYDVAIVALSCFEICENMRSTAAYCRYSAGLVERGCWAQHPGPGTDESESEPGPGERQRVGQATGRAVTRSWRTGGPASSADRGAPVGGGASAAAGAAVFRVSARSPITRARACDWAPSATTTCSSCALAGPETATPERAPPPGPSMMVPEYPIRRSAIDTLSPSRALQVARADVGAPLGVRTDALLGPLPDPGSTAITRGNGSSPHVAPGSGLSKRRHVLAAASDNSRAIMAPFAACGAAGLWAAALAIPDTRPLRSASLAPTEAPTLARSGATAPATSRRACAAARPSATRSLPNAGGASGDGAGGACGNGCPGAAPMVRLPCDIARLRATAESSSSSRAGDFSAITYPAPAPPAESSAGASARCGFSTAVTDLAESSARRS